MPRDKAILFLGDMFVMARQSALFQHAHERGYNCILATTPDTDQGDLSRMVEDSESSFSCIRETVQACGKSAVDFMAAVQPLLSRYEISAVVPGGEMYVTAGGLLADCWGLPGVGAKAATVCRNKLMQRYCNPKYSPKFMVVSPNERNSVDPDVGDKCIIKPLDLNYSRGVQSLEDTTEVSDRLAEYPTDQVLLIEELVEGPEFSVESFLQNGEIIWSGVTGKRLDDEAGGHFTEMSHTCPAEIDTAMEEALLSVNRNVVENVGVQNGMTHAEYKVSERGPILMEIAARRPGDEITYLWEMATGASVESTLIDIMLGVDAHYPEPFRRARHEFISHDYGKLVHVSSSESEVYWLIKDYQWPTVSVGEPQDPPRCQGVLVHKVPGDQMGFLYDSRDRSVSFLFDAAMHSDMDKISQEISENISVYVE